MQKPIRTLVILLVVLTSVIGGTRFINGVEAQSTAVSRPVPCIIEGPEVYLVIDNTLRHIVDWDTFLSLGYLQPDIIPCGASAAYTVGSPITRLLRGSDAPVYWMENGLRRHIPDMATFTALGFQISGIAILPDSLLSLWPLGDPLPRLTELPDQLTPIPVDSVGCSVELLTAVPVYEYAVLREPIGWTQPGDIYPVLHRTYRGWVEIPFGANGSAWFMSGSNTRLSGNCPPVPLSQVPLTPIPAPINPEECSVVTQSGVPFYQTTVAQFPVGWTLPGEMYPVITLAQDAWVKILVNASASAWLSLVDDAQLVGDNCFGSPS